MRNNCHSNRLIIMKPFRSVVIQFVKLLQSFWIIVTGLTRFARNDILLATLPLFLSSCAPLKPLYGSEYRSEEKLKKVEIEEINTINGAEIYHNLSRLIGETEGSTHLLRITNNSDSSYPLAISGHSKVLKQNVAQQYSYILIDKDTGKVVDEGRVRMVGSYSAGGTSFNSYTNEKSIKKNLAQNIAEEIHIRLLLYFASN